MNRRHIKVVERPDDTAFAQPKAVILAGGPARFSDAPRALVEIGGRPLLWHTLTHFASYGFEDFLVGLGYKGDHVKRYLLDYYALKGDLSIDMAHGAVRRNDVSASWAVDLVDTGVETLSGGRLRRLAPRLHDTFILALSAGVSNVDLDAMLAFHRSHGRLATIATVQAPPRFGALSIDGDQITGFAEKVEETWISAGIFIVEPGALAFIENDNVAWEREPLERLACDGELMAYKHDSFWHSLDTLRDRQTLDSLWQSGEAPWRSRVSIPAAI